MFELFDRHRGARREFVFSRGGLLWPRVLTCSSVLSTFLWQEFPSEDVLSRAFILQLEDGEAAQQRERYRHGTVTDAKRRGH